MVVVPHLSPFSHKPQQNIYTISKRRLILLSPQTSTTSHIEKFDAQRSENGNLGAAPQSHNVFIMVLSGKYGKTQCDAGRHQVMKRRAPTKVHSIHNCLETYVEFLLIYRNSLSTFLLVKKQLEFIWVMFRRGVLIQEFGFV